MATGFNHHMNNYGGPPPNVTDLVANSALTATASEFVPNSAKKNKNFRKPKSSKIYVSSSRNHREKESSDVHNGFAEPSSVEDNGSSHRRHQNLEAFSASSTSAQNLSYDSGIPAQSFGNPTGGQSSKSSPQYLGKNFNGPRSYNRGRQDWTGQSSGSYSNSNSNVQAVQDEGAVGIDHVQTFCNRNTASGYIKSKSRYGNNHSKNQQLEQPFYNDRPKFRDYRDRESSTSQRKDSNRVYDKDFGYGREKPRIWERGNNQLERNVSSYADDSFRDSGSSERSKNQYSERGRDTDFGRERPRVWERNNQLERNVSSYADDSFRDSGLSERSKSQYSGRGQDQDRYSSYRPNRRYADRYPGGKHEETNRDRNFGNHDFDERNYDRSYGSGGLRLKPDFSKEDFSGQRNTTYQQGRNTTQNFNTLETFDSNPGKFQAKESSKQYKEWYYSNTRERNESSSRVQTGLKTMDMKDCDDISQRERLTEQLNRGTLECLVCCDRVRQSDSVWSCSNCFHVLHLRCVIKWAKSSKAETGWRCPACQNITENVPSQYRCFCGKILEPQWNRQDTPHTCGEVCGKSRESRRTDCTHRCNLLCHPGPCPSCVAQVTRNCGCGKTSQMVKCALEKPVLCDAICGKILNCGVHFCEIKCHPGPCSSCQQEIDQVCFCKKQRRKVTCIPENQGVFEFSCNEPCYQELTCGNHKCEEICHEGKCKSCQLAPDIITHCPCGQTELSQHVDEKRKTCLDPIPTCEKLCGRKLSCGQPSNPHMCKLKCHPGTCPPCPFTTMVRCRCGHMDKEIPCNQLTSKADDARCEKKCTRKRSCAKHKCNQLCCIEIDHPCPLPCNHTLSCGLHRCDQLCHRGHCQPCWRTSFEELFCECGAEVMYPPVACGTKPPSCSRPCTRVHDCEHPALHTCHNDPNCPPCTVLTQKYCYGNHELRKSIPCHQIEFSCGLPCNKELPCGHHKCILVCHKGDCLREGAVCTQPCNVLRPPCQHPCSAPCHEGSCPESPCKETVRVTCECGHRSATRPCAENTKEYQRIATSLLASKMADVQLGHSIDISDIMGNATTKRLYLKSLDCNEECKVIERNRRMAIGLQIRNPDLSQKLTPRYSDFMRGWAKKDPVFCQNIHDRLTDLVKLAKESKQKSRSHSFEVMNRERRQFVHEYCEHFGCESVAYDQEPKRNVVATAQKAKAWLPSVGLLELVQREAGQRKVPGPILNSVKRLPSSNMDTLASKWASKTSSVNDSFSSISGQASNSSVLPIGGLNPSCYDDNSANGSSTTHFIDHFNS